MSTGGENRAEIKALGQHTDYSNRCVVERDGAADDMRIGRKTPLPQTMTQHYRFGAIPFAFVGGEVMAELRLDSEKREKVLGNRQGAVHSQLAIAHAVKSEIRRHIREGLIALFQREKRQDLERLRR